MSEDSARKDQHFWNGVALLAFAALFGLCGAIVAEFGVTDLVSVGAFDLLVMGLATFRLLHLLTFDKIFDGVRATVMEGARLKVANRGWRRLASEFMQCIWCTRDVVRRARRHNLYARKLGAVCRDRSGRGGTRLTAAGFL
jgi:hypothetical protein